MFLRSQNIAADISLIQHMNHTEPVLAPRREISQEEKRYLNIAGIPKHFRNIKSDRIDGNANWALALIHSPGD